MTTDAMTNLQHAVHDHFTELYQNTTGDQLLLGFEPIGISVVDSEYRAPDGTFDIERGREQTAALADHSRKLHSGTAARTLLAATALEEFILSGQALPDASAEIIALFEKMKAQDLKTYDAVTFPAKLTGVDYSPVTATPSQWYDAANPAWATFTSTVDETPVEPPPTGGDVLVETSPWIMQVLDPADRQIVEASEDTLHETLMTRVEPVVDPPIVEAAVVDPVVDTAVVDATVSPVTEFSPEVLATIEPANAAPPQVLAAERDLNVVIAAPALQFASRAKARRHGFARSRLTLEAEPTVSLADEQISDLVQLDRLRLTAVEVDNSVLLQQVADTATPQTVGGSHISISFSSMLVTIDRPWWSASLLLMQDWYIPSFAKGAFSDGSLDANTGAAPALPTAFIAVRDVQLSGSWSETDRAALPDALSFGPFSLVGRTITTTDETLTISVPGIQIVAWICSMLPVLPPADDPHRT